MKNLLTLIYRKLQYNLGNLIWLKHGTLTIGNIELNVSISDNEKHWMPLDRCALVIIVPKIYCIILKSCICVMVTWNLDMNEFVQMHRLYPSKVVWHFIVFNVMVMWPVAWYITSVWSHKAVLWKSRSISDIGDSHIVRFCNSYAKNEDNQYWYH